MAMYVNLVPNGVGLYPWNLPIPYIHFCRSYNNFHFIRRLSLRADRTFSIVSDGIWSIRKPSESNVCNIHYFQMVIDGISNDRWISIERILKILNYIFENVVRYKNSMYFGTLATVPFVAGPKITWIPTHNNEPWKSVCESAWITDVHTDLQWEQTFFKRIYGPNQGYQGQKILTICLLRLFEFPGIVLLQKKKKEASHQYF